MDTSIIASRYAKALLKYVAQTGGGERVCRDAMQIEASLSQVKEFALVADSPEGVSEEEKVSLFRTAAGGELAPETERFIRLVIREERIGMIRLMLRVFIKIYDKWKGVARCHLTTVVPPTPELMDYLRGRVKEATGCEAEIEVSMDPSLIGGFLFEMDDYQIDATVKSQLEAVRRRYIDNNRRIV